MEAQERSCLSGRFVDGFLDLPKQFGRVRSSKEYSLLVVLGGSTIMFYARAVAKLPRILFGHKRDKTFDFGGHVLALFSQSLMCPSYGVIERSARTSFSCPFRSFGVICTKFW